MVDMLMGNQNSVQFLRRAVQTVQPCLHAFSADSRINQKARSLTSRKNTVSAGTAGNTTKFHTFLFPDAPLRHQGI